MSEELTQAPAKVEELKPGSVVTGKVTQIVLGGAMVDIGHEQDALLHISQLDRSKVKNGVRNMEDIYKPGDTVEDAYVLKVDDKGRVALTMVKPPALPWTDINRGQMYTGTVTRIENYGAFVDIGAERPGMVHVSELADGFIKSPEDVVSVGDEVEVRVIKLNRRNRQIDLSMKTAMEDVQAAVEPEQNIPTAMELALRRAQEEASQDDAPAKSKREKKNNNMIDDIISRTLRNHNN